MEDRWPCLAVSSSVSNLGKRAASPVKVMEDTTSEEVTAWSM